MDLSDIVTDAFWRVAPKDLDPAETREWLDAFDALIQAEGAERATFLLRKLLEHARAKKVKLPPVFNTPYANTMPLAEQPQFPGNLDIEQRLVGIVRWNALAMVVRANRASAELGGHIASYASAADLFEVGFNHFFRGGVTPTAPTTTATSSTSSRTRHPACTRAPISKAGCRRSRSRTTGARSAARACRRIRIRC